MMKVLNWYIDAEYADEAAMAVSRLREVLSCGGAKMWQVSPQTWEVEVSCREEDAALVESYFAAIV